MNLLQQEQCENIMQNEAEVILSYFRLCNNLFVFFLEIYTLSHANIIYNSTSSTMIV